MNIDTATLYAEAGQIALELRFKERALDTYEQVVVPGLHTEIGRLNEQAAALQADLAQAEASVKAIRGRIASGKGLSLCDDCRINVRTLLDGPDAQPEGSTTSP